MAPIRRYLRITKYSVLEVRIYLDNPALAHSWLLNPRNPVLPRVIESVRPYVLPKLREEQERERNRRKSAKKRSIKDVVREDDFEVSLFLVDMTTRHSLLHKQKHFRDKSQTKLTSNSARLTGPSHDAPIDVDSAPPTVMLSEEDQAGGSGKEQTGHGELLLAPPAPGLLREESDEDEPMQLSAIPVVDETASDTAGPATRQLKRRRDGPGFGGETSGEGHADATKEAAGEEAEKDDSQEGSEVDELFVGASDDDVASEDSDLIAPPNKRQRAKTVLADDEDRDLALGGDEDTKKKLAMDISYEGFAIYGRALCLVISRRDGGKGGMAAARGGAARTVDWITSTQLPPEAAGEP